MDENTRASRILAPNHGSSPKEWLTPTLRRLPIAATAGVPLFNEGVGKGKGESGDESPS
jgi:hypothetical protein